MIVFRSLASSTVVMILIGWTCLISFVVACSLPPFTKQYIQLCTSNSGTSGEQVYTAFKRRHERVTREIAKNVLKNDVGAKWPEPDMNALFNSLNDSNMDVAVSKSLHDFIELTKYRLGLWITTHLMPKIFESTDNLDVQFGLQAFDTSAYLRLVLEDTMSLLGNILKYANHVLGADIKGNPVAYANALQYFDVLNMQLQMIFRTATDEDCRVLPFYVINIFRIVRPNLSLVLGRRSYREAFEDLCGDSKRDAGNIFGPNTVMTLRSQMDFAKYDFIQVQLYYEDQFIYRILQGLPDGDTIFRFFQMFENVNMFSMQAKKELFQANNNKHIDQDIQAIHDRTRRGMMKSLDYVLTLYWVGGIRERLYFRFWLNELHSIDRIKSIYPGMGIIPSEASGIDESFKRDLAEASYQKDAVYVDLVASRLQFLRTFQLVDINQHDLLNFLNSML